MEEISKNKSNLYYSLSKAKYRKRHSLFMAEGAKCVEDLLSNFELENIIAIEAWYDSHPQIVQRFSDKALYTTAEGIKRISSLSTPPEVVGIFKMPVVSEEERLPDNKGLNLILDGIQDPGNLGTIIRTAHWFGISHIFASVDTADIYNPKTIQSTMGSLGKVRVTYCDIAHLIEEYPDLSVYGTLLNGDNIYEAKLSDCGFIVMGNEGRGISPAIRELITNPLLIPPYNPDNHSESLNVSIATAVTLSQFRGRGL